MLIFLNYLLSGGLKSPLYKYVREKENLAYYINCRMDRLQNTGVILISTETNDINIENISFKTKNNSMNRYRIVEEQTRH